MIDLCYSNRTEPLLDALAENVAATQGSLYDPVNVLVPGAFVASSVSQGLARRRGIAAHVKTRFLRAFLRDVAAASAPGLRIVDRDILEGALLASFHDEDRLAADDLAPVRGYLHPGDGDRTALDRRRAQLAAQLADLFDEYAYSRPEMLAAWKKGSVIAGWNEPLQRWQRALWLGLFGRGGRFSGADAATLPDFFARTPPAALRVPGAVHVFGISFVARLYHSIFGVLGRVTSLFVYTLNPCRELWEDLQPARKASPKRRVSSRQLAFALDDDASAAAAPAADENPLLALWGRPGRDSIRLYNELSDCNFRERFEDPTAKLPAPTLLATLQREVLERAPRRHQSLLAEDDSLTICAAPDPRRELEAVAAEIWSLVRRDETLRFEDFAVVVPPASAATYLPLAREVFAAASELPHTVLELPSPGEGHVAEAVELLLALPTGPLGRRDLLALAMHPTVARRFPDVDPQHFLALCEALGIVRGADGADLADGYADDDRVSWDQGLRRLALGAFLSGPRSGEQRPFSGDGRTALAAELSPGAEPAARALGIIARELIDFARTARETTASIAEHMALLRRTLAAVIRPDGDEEEAILRDGFAILEGLSETAPADLEVGYAVAAELVRARLRTGRGGGRAPQGVRVGGLAPLRALTFRTVFVVGLGERVFPSAEGFSALDLRAAAPQPGDVSPRERDEYMFLETLLSARDRLRLSYVGRDEVTGEQKDPSSTLLALCDALAAGPAGEELVRAIRRKTPPLARHEDDDVCAVVPAAARERQAAALGRSLRQAAQLIQLPEPSVVGAALAPAAWDAMAPALGRVSLGAKPDAPRREITALTLADLRRFLECPLQGSVRVLLPMRDDDDAEDEAEAALRERENLGDVRLRTLPLLREVFARAIDAGATDDDALTSRYDEAAAHLRFDGTLPSGLFGNVVRTQHVAMLQSWREGLRAALGALPTGLAPIWYGAAPEHRPGVQLSPAVTLSVPLRDGPRTLSLFGQSEPIALVGGERIAMTLITARSRDDYPERDRLRAWLTHLALAASGAGPDRKLASLIVGAVRDAPAQVTRIDLQPISQADAAAHLAALASDLLSGVHAYLMPCEGVFTWWHRLRREQPLTVPEAVMLVRDDGFTFLSSERGPVDDALRYPVPAQADADAYVARRFGRYLDSLREPG